jgi:hypothetical protein
MPTTNPIVIDELKRAWEERTQLLERRRSLLTQRHAREKQRIDDERKLQADPLIRGVWDVLKLSSDPPRAGVMRSQTGSPPWPGKLAPHELMAMVVYWKLVQAGLTDPDASGFAREAYRRKVEFDGAAGRYKRAADEIVTPEGRLSCAAVEGVVSHLVEQDEPADANTVKAAIEHIEDQRRHRYKYRDFSLADGDLDAAVDLKADHLRAAAMVYAHDRLDQAGIFDAVDQIIEDADFGRIEIGPGAIEDIERYRRRATLRWLSPDRLQALRGRVLGPPFPQLWRGLITATHDFVARLTTVDLVGSKISVRIAAEPVRVAALALATQTSEAGWGTTPAAAETLRRQLLDAREILEAKSIVRAYCSRDFLGVVAHAADADVNALTREFALADAGTTVFSWLALKAEDLENDDLPILDIDELGGPGNTDPDGPDDADFAAAAEQIYQLLGYAPDVEDEDSEGDEETDEEDEDEDGDFQVGHGYRQRGVFTLKPSMFTNGARQ